MKQKNFRFTIVLVTSIIFLCGVWYNFQPKVVLVHKEETLEIHGTYDAKSFISKVRNGNLEDVIIEDTTDVKKVGTYKILYTIDGHKSTLTFHIIDSKQPIVTLKDLKRSVNHPPEAKDFIEKIEDDSTTTVSFKESYNFKDLKVYDVIIVVEDEGGNITESTAKVEILEADTAPPEILGLGQRSIRFGEEIDLLAGISAVDERDGNVEVTVTDDNGFSSTVPGTYTVSYEARDTSDNIATSTSTFIVSQNDNSKIIYMTFDDGPSANTQGILDVLDKYNVKATFFVTGAYPNYASYISEEHKRGHAIGLHTYSHKYDVLYSSEDAYFNDLNAVSDVVYNQIGIRSKLIRFPGGGSNTISSKYTTGIMTSLTAKVRTVGYQYYDWNSENGDGRSGMTADDLVATAISSGGNKETIMMLLHDGAGSQETVKALPRIIEHFKNKGYTFKPIDLGVSGFHHNVNN